MEAGEGGRKKKKKAKKIKYKQNENDHQEEKRKNRKLCIRWPGPRLASLLYAGVVAVFSEQFSTFYSSDF